MTIIIVVYIKRDENSKWEKALKLDIDKFDAINRIYDNDGFEIDEFYDIKYTRNSKFIDIPFFP